MISKELSSHMGIVNSNFLPSNTMLKFVGPSNCVTNLNDVMQTVMNKVVVVTFGCQVLVQASLLGDRQPWQQKEIRISRRMCSLSCVPPYAIPLS